MRLLIHTQRHTSWTGSRCPGSEPHALQLAAAWVACDERPDVLACVTLGDRLAEGPPRRFRRSASVLSGLTKSPRVNLPRRGACTSAHWRQYGAMPSVQIKDVPADAHAILRRRAADAHQSLQEYLRTKLIEEARRPTVDEVLARAGGRAGGSLTLKAAARAVRRDRARR